MASSKHNIDRQVYTLAAIGHIRKYPPGPSTRARARYDKMENSQLLNYIVLLLVNKEEGDIAAVSMRMSSEKVDFYYAKNGPCDPEVQEALAEDDLDVMSRRLIRSFLTACVNKFKGMVTKARRALLDFEDIIGPDSMFEGKKTMSSCLQEWRDLNDRQILISFFKELKALDLANGALQANRHAPSILSMKAFYHRYYAPASFLVANFSNLGFRSGRFFDTIPKITRPYPETWSIFWGYTTST